MGVLHGRSAGGSRAGEFYSPPRLCARQSVPNVYVLDSDTLDSMFDAARFRPTDSLRSFFAVPFDPQTYLNLLYLALAFPLGLLYVIFAVVGVSLGVALTIVIVGVPILLVVVAVALGIAGFERWQASLLLGVTFDDDAATADGSDDGDTPAAVRRALGVLADPATWLAVVYLPVKFAVGTAALVFITAVLSTAVSMLFVPLYYQQPGVYVGFLADRPVELHPTLHLGWNRLLVTLEPVITFGFWRITTIWEALVVAGVGLLLVLVALHALNGLARLSGWFTRLLLGDTAGALASARRRLPDR